MKKIVLSCALLFAVTCAKANDIVADKEVVSEAITVVSEETVVTVKSVGKDVAVMPECFALTCQVVCFDDEYFSGIDIAEVFKMLEAFYCSQGFDPGGF